MKFRLQIALEPLQPSIRSAGNALLVKFRKDVKALTGLDNSDFMLDHDESERSLDVSLSIMDALDRNAACGQEIVCLRSCPFSSVRVHWTRLVVGFGLQHQLLRVPCKFQRQCSVRDCAVQATVWSDLLTVPNGFQTTHRNSS